MTVHIPVSLSRALTQLGPLALPVASRDSWRYWFSVERVPATGEHCLEVSSQYVGGNDPGYLARKFQLNCSLTDLELLHTWLGRYLAEQREALRNSNS